MAQSIKTVRRFNQLYRNFSFSELMAKADELLSTPPTLEMVDVLAEK